jgi:hypothetical protein
MSFRDATKPQDLGPERLKPAEGAPILDPSVEAEAAATDLCTGPVSPDVARARILAWLAEGAREVTWALCSLPRERWAAQPPARLDNWPALRHVHHVALHEIHRVLPLVRQALGESPAEAPALSTTQLDRIDAAWDAALVVDSAEEIVSGLGQCRFELLQRLEAAPDTAWQRPPVAIVAEDAGRTQPIDLDWLLLSARQHELQHLAVIWKIALNWGPRSFAPGPGVPLQPADRLEESH